MAVGLDGPAAYVFAGRMVALGCGVATALLASRVLGPYGRGLVVGFSVVQFLVATGLALGTGSAAYLLAARGEVDGRALSAGIAAVAFVIGVVTVLAAGVATITGYASRALPGEDPAVVLLLAPAAASQYAVVAAGQLAMGTARPVATMATLAAAPVLLLGATAAAASVDAEPGTMIAAHAVAWVAAAAVAFAFARPRPSRLVEVVRRLVRVGFPAALGDVANALSYRSDVLVLGLLAGPAAVGVYALAVQALEPLWLLAGSAAGGLLIALPGQRATTWKSTIVRATVRVSVVTAVGVAAVVALMPGISAIAGPGFESAPVVALALAPGIVFLAVSKTLAVAPLVRGRLWWGTAISSTSLAANVVANLILVPGLGAVGSALGSTASYGISSALWLTALRRQ